MMSATLILPTTNDIPTDIINSVIRNHRLQGAELTIIISNHGPRADKNNIHAMVVERSYDGNFSLAKTRNAAAWMSDNEWLIFSDIDTIYKPNIFSELIALGHDAVAGKKRRDVYVDGNVGEYYHCGFAPLLIKRALFEEIGGYCEHFAGYGYEDSHLQHKIVGLVDVDAQADHLIEIHNVISNITDWQRDDSNRNLFFADLEITLNDRIIRDKRHYMQEKANFKAL